MKHYVYARLCPIRQAEDLSKVCPAERRAYVEEASNPAVKNARYTVWMLLCELISDRLGLDAQDCNFRRDEYGKWTADRFCFSLSHADGLALAVISDRPIGADIENLASFREKYTGEKGEKLAARIGTPSERTAPLASPDALCDLWTKKEALFKARGAGVFRPERTDTAHLPFFRETGEWAGVPYVLNVYCQDGALTIEKAL